VGAARLIARLLWTELRVQTSVRDDQVQKYPHKAGRDAFVQRLLLELIAMIHICTLPIMVLAAVWGVFIQQKT
jgi:hypothetical protein